jgi:outer membrane usher protein
VNQVDKGEIVVLLRASDVLARVADLEASGLRGLAGQREAVEGEVYVSLASLQPGLRYELDERALVLRLTVEPSLLGETVLNLQPGRPAGLVYSRDPSAFLNYAVSLFDFERYAVFGEAGFSTGQDLLFSSASRTPDGGLVRGLTNYTLDDRARLVRWVAGDSLASSGTLGASLVMGGLGVSREFGLDPYFVRYPTVGLSGAALTPSTAEVYIDGVLIRREPLPPGPFELRNLPVPAGSSLSRVVLRDAFGREQEIVAPFYFTTALLGRGLHEFSYTLGAPRENLGTASFDYGSPAFLGRHRVGLTDGLTVGGRLELSTDIQSGGPSLTTRLPVGEAEVALALSRDGDRSGWAGSLGYTYLAQPFSFGGLVRALSDEYATLSLKAADDRPRLEASAFVGFQLGRRTSVTLQYTRAELRDKGDRDRASIFTSIRLSDRANLFLSASHSREAGTTAPDGTGTASGTTTELFAALTYFFGTRTSGTLSYQRHGSENTAAVELQQALPVGSGFGYRVQAAASESRQFGAGLAQYQGPYGRYEVGYANNDGHQATTLNAAGGVIALGGAAYPTRVVQDSFGLLRVPGVEGVRGYVNNQEIGQTNARGDLPVPNLLAYYGNRLSIKDEDVPLDRRVDTVETTVGPPFRGGAVVVFPVQRIQTLSGSLLLEHAGRVAAPAFGQLTVTAAGQSFDSPIGRQGEFYFENLPAGRHPAVIEHEEATCRFTLEVPVSTAPVVDLGTVRCAVPPGSERGGTP